MPTPSSQPNPNFNFAEPSNHTPPVPDAFKAPRPGALSSPVPPTRIYPQPINPPPVPTARPTPAPAPAPSRPSGRSGGRIAGSFKMPPGSGAAARGGAAVVGRRIPYVALAFLAYDAYQLACTFGLIPGSVCPRPDNPSPGGTNPGFSGGQCQTEYFVNFVHTNGRVEYRNQGCFGPIRFINVQEKNTGFGAPFDRAWYIVVGCTNPYQGYKQIVTDFFAGYSVYGNQQKFTSIEIAVNAPDNCGNPNPDPSPQRMPDIINNINNINNNINLNFTVPNPAPPSPQPKPAPRIISPPSPFPDININFGDNYFGGGDTDYDFDIDFNFSPAPKGNFNDYPDIFNNFPPSPQPQTKDPDPFPKENPPPQAAPQPKPIPELPPPLPDKLPENSTDEDKYIYRQNKETLDKVYKANAEILEIQKEQLKQRKILENIQSLLDFEVEGSQLIKRCDDVEVFYSYKDKVLKAISKQIQHVQAIEQTIINEVCEIEKESVVASPDWWQVRLKGDVPQIALVFRAVGTKTYYKLTVPHPLNVNKLTAPPINTYKKGNWQGEIVCVDNSKFIVNCESKIEAERVINIALLFIDPVFTGLTPRLYFAERKGIAVSTGDMLATSALYFSRGQQSTIPDWRVAFKYL
jgi:hypothetical protein